MNTSSYRYIASSMYNSWKVVLKTKMTKTSVQRRLWQNFIQRVWWFPFLYILGHCCWKEMRAKVCVFWFGAAFNSFPVISQWCLVATWSSVRLGGSHFYTYNSGFPCALFAFLLCYWLWISAIHKMVIQFTCLIYITSLLIWRRDNILLADFRILTICIINLYILYGMFLVLI